MLTSVQDHPTLGSPASAPVPTIERAALILFAANDDGLYKLMPADSASRFADLRATLREAKHANGGARRPQTDPGPLSPAAARLKDATTYYQQHVLAWYALGWVREARAAREAITHCREALAAEHPAQRGRRNHDRTTATPPRGKAIVRSRRRGTIALLPED